jgi:hypothetical protein
MKLKDIFVPRYLHSDPNVRLKFVQKSQDAKLLQQMSEKDTDVTVRKTAAERAQKLQGNRAAA